MEPVILLPHKDTTHSTKSSSSARSLRQADRIATSLSKYF